MEITVTNCSSCQGTHEVLFEDLKKPDNEGYTMVGKCPVTDAELFLKKDERWTFLPFTTFYEADDEIYECGWGPLQDSSQVGKRNNKAVRRKPCLKSEKM